MIRNSASVWLVVAFAALSVACGEKTAAVSEARPAAAVTAAPAPPAAQSDSVVLGPGAPELSNMTIEPARAVPIPGDDVTAPAVIEVNPNRVGHVTLPVPGRIVRLMAKLGDAVEKGQPVAVIESPLAAEAESAFLQAESAVRQMQLAAAKADADLARLQDLLQHDAVARKEVLSAETTVALSRSAIEQTQNARDQARVKLELLGLKPGQSRQTVTVVAPVSGKVMEVAAAEGEFHNEVSTPLMTIADLSRVWATSEVPESDIRHYHPGGAADIELIAFPGRTFRARITRIADTVDKDTRTVRVNAELENEGGRLLPEMFGRIRYTGPAEPGTWIPDGAVVQRNGRDYVFIEVSAGHFQVIPVTLGRRLENGYAVSSGLKAGQRVVTKGSVYLKAAL